MPGFAAAVACQVPEFFANRLVVNVVQIDRVAAPARGAVAAGECQAEDSWQPGLSAMCCLSMLSGRWWLVLAELVLHFVQIVSNYCVDAGSMPFLRTASHLE